MTMLEKLAVLISKGVILDEPSETIARAVLTALREPDRRAWEAARWTDDDGHAEPSLNTLAEFLPAYIDAILNEKAAK